MFAVPGSAVFAVEEPVEEITEAAAVESAEIAPGSAIVIAVEEPAEEIAEAARVESAEVALWFCSVRTCRGVGRSYAPARRFWQQKGQSNPSRNR